jgi:RNA polymerase sigma factor (TIGR02999 family)
VVPSAVEVRQGFDARGDELWLDAPARDALGFAVMARVGTEGPTPSTAAPSTPPRVHEAFLRLIGEKNLVWQNRSHFIGIFARVMRQTLTNYAVARHRLKRGGSDPLRLTLEFYDSRKIDVTALDEALQTLEALDERQARIVELRFFAGLTVEETAELLEISPATVKRDWTLAKIWLRRELSAN